MLPSLRALSSRWHNVPLQVRKIASVFAVTYSIIARFPMPMIWLYARKNSKLQTPDAAHQLHEHKNPDFVLEKPENGGSEGQKSTKTTILCSGGLVCALSAGQQPAGSRKHPAGNQKKTACNQKQTRPEPKHPGRPPETNRLVSKKSAGAPRWSAGRPLCK